MGSDRMPHCKPVGLWPLLGCTHCIDMAATWEGRWASQNTPRLCLLPAASMLPWTWPPRGKAGRLSGMEHPGGLDSRRAKPG